MGTAQKFCIEVGLTAKGVNFTITDQRSMGLLSENALIIQ